MKKHLCHVMMFVLLLNGIFTTNGKADPGILSEPITGTYYGRTTGSSVIENINFKDVSATNWAKETVTRIGALDIVEGTGNGYYSPKSTVSKEVALTMIVRAIGMEADAVLADETLTLNNANDPAMKSLWSKGYLQVARNIGLITAGELADGLSTDVTALDPATSFVRSSAVSREQMAKWLVNALNTKDPNLIAPVYNLEVQNNYLDGSKIGAEFKPYVEAVLRNQIMVGSNRYFRPMDSLQRDELAQVMKNLDEILFGALGITRTMGTVEAITDNGNLNNGSQTMLRTFYIRNEDGTASTLNYEYKQDQIKRTVLKDAPVYRSGAIASMATLMEGEAIEYFVTKDKGEILYVNSSGTTNTVEITGTLQPLNKLNQGQVTLRYTNGVDYTFQMGQGLYNPTALTLKIDGLTYTVATAPVSHQVTLSVKDNMVTGIHYNGDAVLANEISGIVKENNPSFSYITITDWSGKQVTKYYKKTNITVEKQNYYDEYDEIGYIDELFPDYRFDERDTTIDAVEPGDIVHMVVDPKATSYVTAISAKTNYIVKYGTIKSVTYKGSEGATATVTMDDLSTYVYDIKSNIPVLKSNQNVGIYGLVAGDIVKLLVNQAVLKPGTVTESVKEVVIDPYGHQVANVYKGQLGLVDEGQKKLSIINIYTLAQTGWRDYAPAKVLDISNSNIEYYQGNQKISLAYAQKYLKTSTMNVYVVTTNYYGSEKVEKVTFRDERDSVLAQTTVTYANGSDQMKLLSQTTPIALDPGTIVVKNGKLVESGSVMAPDYAQVVLNGQGKAAVVQIVPEPNNDAIAIFRGRIAKINEGTTFEIQSHAVLKDMTWIYAPISRTFTMDYETKIVDENGTIPFNAFIDYSEISQVDEVYTVIAEGTKAKYVVKNPYVEEGVKGEVYGVDDKKIQIKDVMVYDSTLKKWTTLSLKNSYAEALYYTNTVIIKNNKVITPGELKIGDKIRVMTKVKLTDQLAKTGDRSFDGYVILVEN